MMILHYLLWLLYHISWYLQLKLLFHLLKIQRFHSFVSLTKKYNYYWKLIRLKLELIDLLINKQFSIRILSGSLIFYAGPILAVYYVEWSHIIGWPFFKIFANCVHFCLNFQTFCPFFPFFLKNCMHGLTL